jgi:hypothetical protein
MLWSYYQSRCQSVSFRKDADAFVDPTDRYLRAWKPVPSCLQFNQQRVLSYFFSLLLSPSPSSTGRLPPSWRNEKPRLRSWKLEPNLTAIREGPTERKTALEITGSIIRRLRGIKLGVEPLRIVRDQYLLVRANFFHLNQAVSNRRPGLRLQNTRRLTSL